MPKVRYRFQARGSAGWPERAVAAIRNFNDGGPKPPKQTRRPKAPAMRFFERGNASGAGVQHRDSAAVLRPARDVVAHRDRTFLAVGDGPHPRGIDAARRQEGPNRLGTAGAQRQVVIWGGPPPRHGFQW